MPQTTALPACLQSTTIASIEHVVFFTALSPLSGLTFGLDVPCFGCIIPVGHKTPSVSLHV